jgi:SLAP domain-containing protein
MEKKENEQNNLNINVLKLSMIDGSEEYMSGFHREILEEELAELPPIAENDVNISLVYFYENEDDYDAKVFIRNNTNKAVNFDKITLAVLDDKGKKVAVQSFDLKYLGTIPAYSARPAELKFSRENVFGENFMDKALSIAFHTDIKAFKNVDIKFPESAKNIVNEFSIEYGRFIENLKVMKENQLTLNTFKIIKNAEGDLRIIIIVRNSYDNEIILSVIPLSVLNEEDRLVSKGLYELTDEQGVLAAHQAKIYEFIIPKDEIIIEDADLEKCRVVFVQ